MKTREALILENIEIERKLMVYKQGLKLAKRFIEIGIKEHYVKPNSWGSLRIYNEFIKEKGLEGL